MFVELSVPMSIRAFASFVSSVVFIHLDYLTIQLPGEYLWFKTFVLSLHCNTCSDESYSLTISIETTSHQCIFSPSALLYLVESSSGRFH
jgi:hypothetical protein